jgi:hypothetical protein
MNDRKSNEAEKLFEQTKAAPVMTAHERVDSSASVRFRTAQSRKVDKRDEMLPHLR